MKRPFGAAMMVALPISLVLAMQCNAEARTPDQLLARPTTIQEPTIKPQCRSGALDYKLLAISWRDPTTHRRRPAYAMLPADREGVNLYDPAKEYWLSVERDPKRFGEHWGIYASEDAAIAAAPLLYRMCARAH